MKQAPIIVSACLIGKRCRYNGDDRAHAGVIRFLSGKKYLAVCPEKLAGWGVPRPPVEFRGGGVAKVLRGDARIEDSSGRDRTKSLMKGVAGALRRALRLQPREAILKEKSPSCGVKKVYRDGKLKRGQGLFAYALRRNGVKVRSEESFAGRSEKP